ncbi:2'-5' RNA ligase family protein [Glycomyces tenuis]|uniref:2'-5' RNA ligase family protein n=1 Tax=Glycomyces tenuis TaxID=58116 RepID=UPI000427F7D1|nr:2'-5' RNA ligase family protein [Glycomyces tenuis]
MTIEIADPWRDLLQQARRACCDPLADRIPPHLTLLAPASIPQGRLEVMSDHLESLARTSRPFSITLHGIASFLPLASVVYVPVVDGGRTCTALASAIRNGPIPVIQRYPFHPHITIAQQADPAALERVCRSLMDFEATITVDRMLLSVSSDAPSNPDASWRPVGEFHFAGHESSLVRMQRGREQPDASRHRSVHGPRLRWGRR